MKHFLLLIFFLFSCCFRSNQVHAQRESSNWLFGRGAGLQFMPDNTIVQFGSSISSREGVSAASDPITGELLFYTDGITVWDKSHGVMQNGNGLLGHSSSCQSGVVVPMPGNPKKYYIFTADFLGSPNGYRYSVVNMAPNLGLGAVESSTKNTLLLQNSSEKITVAQHCNKHDFWLILREAGNSTFWIYLINDNGVQVPKKFSLGTSIIKDTWNEVGCLEMSSNQKILAHAIGPNVVGGVSKVEVFNFDNENGSLTGPFVTLPGYYFAYGVEFSPDSKLLYVSDTNTPGTSSVAQYNISLSNEQSIINSKTVLTTSNSYDYGTIQIAPDGKIYVAKELGYDNGSDYLDVIHSPSTFGTGCMYQENALKLLVGQSLLGLPNFPTYLFTYPPKITAKKNCTTGTFDFKLENSESSSSISWNFGDPNSGAANIAVTLEPSHNFSDTGIFVIRSIILSSCGADTSILSLHINNYQPISDTSFCKGDQVTLVGPSPTTKWNVSSTGSTYQVNQPGSVQYQFVDSYGCLVTDYVQVTEIAPVTTSEKIFICPGDTIWVFNKLIVTPGVFSMTYDATNGCDSLHIVSVTQQSFIHTTQSATICPGSFLNLNGITYTQPGIYQDTIYGTVGCDTALTLTISTQTIIPNIQSATLCPGGSVTFSGVNYTEPGIFLDTIPSITGACDTVLMVTIIQNSDTLFVPEKYSICVGDTLATHGAQLTKAGMYTFQEPSLAACVLIYQVELTLILPPVFDINITPGGCNGKPIGIIEVQNPQPGWQTQFNGGNWSEAMAFNQLLAGRYILNVRNAQGCKSMDTVQVSEAEPFLLKIKIDTTFAECGMLTATASHTSQFPVHYYWSPNEGLNCNDCSTVTLQLEHQQVFQLLAIDSAGCQALAEIAAPGSEIYHIYAPNVFSPNDDGNNDHFILYGNRCARLIRQFSIHDRWGSQVFYKENLTLGDESQGWGGYARSQLATPGVFTWWADIELHSGQRVMLKGSVTIVL